MVILTILVILPLNFRITSQRKSMNGRTSVKIRRWISRGETRVVNQLISDIPVSTNPPRRCCRRRVVSFGQFPPLTSIPGHGEMKERPESRVASKKLARWFLAPLPPPVSSFSPFFNVHSFFPFNGKRSTENHSPSHNFTEDISTRAIHDNSSTAYIHRLSIFAAGSP